MKRTIRHVLNWRWPLGVIALFVIATGCSQGPIGAAMSEDALPATGPSDNSSLDLNNSYEQKALSILQTNCSGCHGSSSGSGGVYGLTDPDHLVSSGLVVVGAPDQSLLYNDIVTGKMPPSGTLSKNDVDTIRQWILAKADSSAGGGAAPGPTPSPNPLQATFASLEANVFVPKCVACHSASRAKGGYRFDTYSKVMASVNVSNPAQSLVYTITARGDMPVGSYQKLTSIEQATLLAWIQAGAPNN
jgi:mono/diheme cytochrome c family protein